MAVVLTENLKVPNILLKYNMVFNSNWNALEQFVMEDYKKQYKGLAAPFCSEFMVKHLSDFSPHFIYELFTSESPVVLMSLVAGCENDW